MAPIPAPLQKWKRLCALPKVCPLFFCCATPVVLVDRIRPRISICLRKLCGRGNQWGHQQAPKSKAVLFKRQGRAPSCFEGTETIYFLTLVCPCLDLSVDYFGCTIWTLQAAVKDFLGKTAQLDFISVHSERPNSPFIQFHETVLSSRPEQTRIFKRPRSLWSSF